jgi:hypothetical protein
MHRITRIAVSLAAAVTALGLAAVLGPGGAFSAPNTAVPKATAGAGKPGPRGPQGPPGLSAAVATYKDGPVPVTTPTPATVASLAIATPGSYVITAKAYATTTSGSGPILACVLDAHGDSDHTQTLAVQDPLAFSLEVVHSFAGAGSADLKCSASKDNVDVNWTKIVAIKVGKLTNTPG